MGWHHQRHALAATAVFLLPLLGVAVAAEGEAAAQGRPSFFSQFRLRDLEGDYTAEIAFAAFVLLYILNLIVGGRANEGLATHWVTEMVRPGGVLDRNFALVGPHAAAAAKGEVLMKETADTYRLYASGRRSCQSLVATLHLRRRQDLLARLWGLVYPGKDILEVEVTLSEGAMAPAVLAVAAASLAAQLQGEEKDLETHAKRVEPAPRELRAAGWASDRLVILAESPGLVLDLLPPPLAESVFGAAAFPALRPFFRYLHISSDYSPAEAAPPRAVVRLCLNLPDRAAPAGPAALERLLAAALAAADAAAAFRPGPEQAKRLADARAARAAEQANKAGGEAAARAEERRAAKAADEKERLRRMTPEARAREQEKKEKLQLKRQRRSMVRMK